MVLRFIRPPSRRRPAMLPDEVLGDGSATGVPARPEPVIRAAEKRRRNGEFILPRALGDRGPPSSASAPSCFAGQQPLSPPRPPAAHHRPMPFHLFFLMPAPPEMSSHTENSAGVQRLPCAEAFLPPSALREEAY